MPAPTTPDQLTPGQAKVAAAHAAANRNAAIRALSNPTQVGRAKRIVQHALARGILTLDDLKPDA